MNSNFSFTSLDTALIVYIIVLIISNWFFKNKSYHMIFILTTYVIISVLYLMNFYFQYKYLNEMYVMTEYLPQEGIPEIAIGFGISALLFVFSSFTTIFFLGKQCYPILENKKN